MRAFGNGHPAICAQNLLRIHRGECPMDRTKGRDPRLINTTNYPRVISDASLVISLWEPRVDVTKIKLIPVQLPDGDFDIQLELERRNGE